MSATPQDALKAITTTDLGDSGTLPREMFDEFFREVQNQAAVLDAVRTVPIGRSKTRIPTISVGERLRRGQAENNDQDLSDVSTGHVDIDAEKGSVYWDLTRETVEENPEREDLADTILTMMAQQWAVDTEDLAFNGDEEDASGGDSQAFLSQNDGWFQVAEDESSPVYDHQETDTDQPIDTDLFHNTIQTLESKYLREINGQAPVFMLNSKQLQEYGYNLTDREDGLGAAVLMADTDVNPFGYDIIGSPVVPEGEGLFTNPMNLIYALRYDVRIEVATETDKTFDNDLFARYKIVGKDDFQIQDSDAVVRIEGIEEVSA